MRISDWSSDVCSSDLRVIPAGAKRSAGTYHYPFEHRCSSRHPVGPGAARLRRLAGMTLSTERLVEAKFIKSRRRSNPATHIPTVVAPARGRFFAQLLAMTGVVHPSRSLRDLRLIGQALCRAILV